MYPYAFFLANMRKSPWRAAGYANHIQMDAFLHPAAAGNRKRHGPIAMPRSTSKKGMERYFLNIIALPRPAPCRQKLQRAKAYRLSPFRRTRRRSRMKRQGWSPPGGFQKAGYISMLPAVRGKGSTSRMLAMPVTYMTILSNPSPKPACFTPPYRRRSRYQS